MRSYSAFLALGIASLLSACSANHDAVFRSFDATQGNSVAIDAKQRLAIANIRKGYYGVPDQMVVCAEPSPDALSVLGASFSASGSEAQKFALDLAGASSESAEKIGLRTQTITVMRDEMYRLCEQYQSGALSAPGFERLQRRNQNYMMGLLAIEQLTGVVSQADTVISSSAPQSPGPNQSQGSGTDNKSTSGDIPQVGGSSGNHSQAAGGVSQASGGVSKGGSSSSSHSQAPGSANNKGTTKGNSTTVRTSSAGAAANAGQNSASPATNSQTGTDVTVQSNSGTVQTRLPGQQLSPEVAIKIADTVGKIVDDLLNTDYSEETCLNFFVDQSNQPIPPQIIDYCTAVLTQAAKTRAAAK